jgi:hypothetical protein
LAKATIVCDTPIPNPSSRRFNCRPHLCGSSVIATTTSATTDSDRSLVSCNRRIVHDSPISSQLFPYSIGSVDFHCQQHFVHVWFPFTSSSRQQCRSEQQYSILYKSTSRSEHSSTKFEQQQQQQQQCISFYAGTTSTTTSTTTNGTLCVSVCSASPSDPRSDHSARAAAAETVCTTTTTTQKVRAVGSSRGATSLYRAVALWPNALYRDAAHCLGATPKRRVVWRSVATRVGERPGRSGNNTRRTRPSSDTQ